LQNGPASGKLLVVGWGGTYGHILSAVREIGDAVSYVHFDYINPLPANTEAVFSQFDKILVCELNSGQFADYLRAKFPGRDIRKFNKVQGQPFLVSELVAAIQKEM
jgi:2-oxoglutarate ferredoxin oxidoreductase subunit alpha